MNTIVGRIALQSSPQPMGASDAREQLLQIRANLVNHGQIRSGYLRMAGPENIKVGGWFTGGNKARASENIRQLIHSAYGDRFADGNRMKEVDRALDRYLGKTGGAIGSRSFVKMINLLERKAELDDSSQAGLAPTRAETGRLDLQGLEQAITAETLEAMKGDSPIGATALAQFKALLPHMESRAFTFFSGLMFPGRSENNPPGAVTAPEAPRTFAMGDADGSMGRMVLHAIASGVARLPEAKMPQLALVLGREYGMDTDADLAGYQSDPAVASALQDIAESIEIVPKPQAGKPACIFLGDILSDRFTNNQDAMSLLIHKLSGWSDTNATGSRVDTGVRFIAGNHDTFAIVPQDPNYGSVSWGGKALHKLAFEPFRQLLLNCFQAADYSGGVLTTHNGVAAGDRPGRFQTGLSTYVSLGKQKKGDGRLQDGSVAKDSLRIKAKSPEDLAIRMNDSFKSYISRGDLYQFYAISTDFRPHDRLMTPKALGFDGIEGFRQLHGHDGSSNETLSGVTNLNARNGRDFNPIAKVIEYAAETSRVDTPPVWA